MSVEKINGIVLREHAFGESGKNVIVLTKEKGKIRIGMRGAKKEKSKLMASAQPFCYSSFVIYEGKGFYSANQAELIESFYNLRNDIVKLAFGTYLLELVEKTHFEGSESDEVLKLLLTALTVLEKTEFDVLLAVSIFEIKFMQLMGLMGTANFCSLCGKNFSETYFFSPFSGGIVCEMCGKKVLDSRQVMKGTFLAINHVLSNEGKKIFAFNVSKEINDELREIMEAYIVENIERRFGTLAFAKKCLKL